VERFRPGRPHRRRLRERPGPKQQALDKATAAVRANARQARVEVEAALREPGTSQEQPADRAARVLNEQISKGIGGRVARMSTRADGTVDLEGTFIELRESGGLVTEWQRYRLAPVLGSLTRPSISSAACRSWAAWKCA
jgi:hypothetical protein